MFPRVSRLIRRGFANFQKDYYKELRINKSASPEEVKAAYHKLAKQWHPDSPTGNSNKFKDIAEAYEVLSDPTQRRSYDSARSGGFYGGDQNQSQHNPFEEFYRRGQGGYNPHESASKQQSEYRRGWQQQDSSAGRRTYRYERVDPFTGKKTTYSYYQSNTFDEAEFKRQQEQAEKFFREFFNSKGFNSFYPDGRTSSKRTQPDEEDDYVDRGYFSGVFRITAAVFTGILVINIISRLFSGSGPNEQAYVYREVRPQHPHSSSESLEDAVRRIRFKD